MEKRAKKHGETVVERWKRRRDERKRRGEKSSDEGEEEGPAGRKRERKREGGLGSAYRSGRVTCVPEVGVLAWTNRRATPLSSSLSPSPFLSGNSLLPSLSLLLALWSLPTRTHRLARLPTYARTLTRCVPA